MSIFKHSVKGVILRKIKGVIVDFEISSETTVYDIFENLYNSFKAKCADLAAFFQIHFKDV